MLSVTDLFSEPPARAMSGHHHLESIAHYAGLGPDLFGIKPWKLRSDDGVFEFRIAPSPRMQRVDPEQRESHIAIGAALYLLRLALRCHGIGARCTYAPDFREPELVSRLIPEGSILPTEEEQSLFAVLAGGPVHHASAAHDLWQPDDLACVRTVAQEELRELTRSMLQPGDVLPYHRASDRSEFKDWLGVRCDGEEPEDQQDLLFWSVGKHDLFDAAPQPAGDPLGVLCTRHDDGASWLDCGQALAKLHLRAGAAGRGLALFNQPLQVPGVRARFARETGFRCFPQAVIRLNP